MPDPVTKHTTSRRKILVVTGSLVSAFVPVAIWLHVRTAPESLPVSSYSHLSFPVYFPSKLPPDFTLDKHSISSTSAVLTYKYDYKKTRPVSVSIQPLDPQLDIGTFRPTREIDTPIGHGYLVEYDDRTTIAIIVSKTFVLINAPQKIPDTAMEQFADSLQAVK